MTALLLLVAAARAGTPTDTAADTADTGVAPTDAPSDTGPSVTGPSDTGPSDTGPSDTGLDRDGDGDGFTPNEGDCDDDEPEAFPGQPEVCTDRIDNDCDGLYDEGCDDSARFASLRGGGGCTGNSGLGTQASVGPIALLALLFAPVLLRRRR